MNKTILAALAISLAIGGSSAIARGQGPDHRGAAMPQFSEIDADGNGQITQAELSEIATSKFADSDTNGDGFLDAEELVTQFQSRMDNMSKGPRNGQGEQAQADPEKAQERADRMASRLADFAERMIERADENDDGKLTFVEITAARPELPFDRIDTDESGAISEMEWHVAQDHRGDRGNRDNRADERGNGRHNR